ncbi:hypothetical protein DYD21_02815 [Rhodohalobacter sp. SW132]|uniref:hypothetical protein n=1 Tax=Rhodohalobacter sp. SW132 TaxID=2293433 RepID=UPI000E379246|nr:hypothetical protein [Rhodohalobacter sp. SW132]REL38901.1 hypothetical protein DYD21_02815 [Rhodohalobacter sp. SW132]
MNTQLKLIFTIQAVVAFVIIFALNYFALNLSLFWSLFWGLAFILIVGIWASFRLKRYREKLKRDSEEKVQKEPKTDG